MSNKRDHPHRRLTTPFSATQPGSSSPMPMMWPMGHFNPYQMYGSSPMAGPGPNTSAACTSTASKPWDESSSSSESEDFVPKKKRKSTKPSAGPSGETAKRGPGRPRKYDKPKEKEDNSKILEAYPPLFFEKDTIAFKEEQECLSCKIYVGQAAYFPCGHHKYCFTCVNKLRTEALTLKRPGKCPEDGCYQLVESWVRLFNVSS